MRKLNQIEIGKDEIVMIYHAEEVLKSIADRFCAANGGDYYARLEIAAEVKYCAEGYPRVWYTVHPYLESLRSGHHTQLELALAEMIGKGEPYVKRQQALQLRAEADRIELDADKLELSHLKRGE